MIIRINAVGTVNLAEALFPLAGASFALVNVASVAAHLLPSFLAPTRLYQLALKDVAAFAEKMISNR